MMWPFETKYPQRTPPQLEREYDYIVVGGGTAGCVLARRLSEDRNASVLLVERGDARDAWLDKSPLLSTHQFSDKKHSVVLQGRLRGDATTDVVAGKGLGGTSRINGMQYTRGVPGEYNAWAQSGCKGWSYEELRPYFERAEGRWSPVTSAHYGMDGLLQVEAPPPSFKFGASREIARATEKLGFPTCSDVNDNGYRSSTFRAFLPKDFALAHQDNLHICTKTVARKVEVERSVDGELRATGVVLQETAPGSPTVFVAARKEVVLCCGAVTTPQVLMLSGIGPAEHLDEVGVPVVHKLDGVGSNLQDHLGTPLSFYAPIWDTWIALFFKPWFLLYQLLRYLILGDGWLRDYYMEASLYTRTDYLDEKLHQKTLDETQEDASRPENVPDIEIMMGAICDFRDPAYDKSQGGFTLLATVLRPHSRGTVRLHSSDPLDPPLVDLGFLSEPADHSTLRTAIRLCMRIGDEMRAGGYNTRPFRAPSSGDDAEVDAYIKEYAQSFLHYSSSCRMGALDDTAGPGVVDDELRVHGVQNLRVCDASIFPRIPAAHLQAPVIAVAEKCADLMKKAAAAAKSGK